MLQPLQKRINGQVHGIGPGRNGYQRPAVHGNILINGQNIGSDRMKNRNVNRLYYRHNL